MKLRTLEKADLAGKRVFVRCGFDVPLNAESVIQDDTRIRECMGTIEFLLKKGAKVILASHNGRPKGKYVQKLSMDSTAEALEQMLGRKVKKMDECVGEEVKAAVMAMKEGDVLLLENLRFHKEEEENDQQFAKSLAELAEVYVNEAFANIHRDHASMTGVPKFLQSYAGFRLQKEFETLSAILHDPKKPLVAVIGGAKISDKIKVIKKFLALADYVLLGGALANTILKAQGISVGKSIVEDEMMQVAKELTLTDNRLRVPVDVITAKSISEDAGVHRRAVANVNEDEFILDIGPDTINLYEMIIKKAKTVVWGGPMGYFEYDQFAEGTRELARMIAESDALSIAGGGDTLDAVKNSGYQKHIDFISTGGGAMLKFFEGAKLPALEILKEK